MQLKIALLSLLLLSPFTQAIEPASDGSWVPVVEFQFEDADFSQTLTWVSGWSFALSAVAREQARTGHGRLLCPDGRGDIESRILLTILNDRFKGQRITAQQASEALWQGVKQHYRCPTGDAAG